MRDTTRRRFLRGSLGAGGALLLGCSGSGGAGSGGGGAGGADPFAGGELLGVVPFAGEGDSPMETAFGAGLDGRLFTDLSKLDEEHPITENERFYIRTRFPDLLASTEDWKIAVGGLVAVEMQIALADLAPLAAPMGVVLLECSGNGSGARFGMLSAAEWSGIPLEKVLEQVEVLPSATAVLVSGFDQHSQPSAKSTPGASWVFTFEQVKQAGGFLATEMNGEPLPLDHGFPVRLVMPGWYGCTCAKWVDTITLVGDAEPATAHMQEFAARTHQDGIPALAKDYTAASMDQAAMPVRIEKWRVGGEIAYRVFGVMWGGYEVTDALAIRFNPDEPWVPVDVYPKQSTRRTWTMWSHAWSPAGPGSYEIRLAVLDPKIPTRRLDSGFYARTVTLSDV
jgi:DMSO/TMAO reductase YedYZ molybdopterin-dependent catalytic subunit